MRPKKLSRAEKETLRALASWPNYRPAVGTESEADCKVLVEKGYVDFADGVYNVKPFHAKRYRRIA